MASKADKKKRGARAQLLSQARFPDTASNDNGTISSPKPSAQVLTQRIARDLHDGLVSVS